MSKIEIGHADCDQCRKGYRPSQHKDETPVRKRIHDWNQNVPEGTEVRVTMDSGEVRETKTRSQAWFCGYQPVVLLEGISGGYILDRINPKVIKWSAQPTLS